MAVEVGSIVEGKVTGVKKFGAFVLLPDGKTGMVHISEVSNEYVQELSDVLSAVSYTHLDVYKRQALGHADGRAACAPSARHAAQGPFPGAAAGVFLPAQRCQRGKI